MSTTRNSGTASFRGGFTLVELLLAISILGVIVGVIATAFSVGVTGWRTGVDAADSVHRADAVMEQLSMALRSTYYPESSSPQYKYGFIHADNGGADADARDTVSFVKLGNALVGEDASYAGVPHRVEVFVSGNEGAEGPGLYVRAWRLDGHDEEFDPQEDVAPFLISREVVGLNCQMIDPEKDGSVLEDAMGELPWTDVWDASNRVPRAVWLTIAVRPGASRKGGDEVSLCDRYVEIPMAELSWNPSFGGGGGRSRDVGRAGDGAGGSQAPRNSGGGERPQGGAPVGGARNNRPGDPNGGRLPVGGGAASAGGGMEAGGAR